MKDHNWANEAQDSTAPAKRRMMPIPVAGKRLDPEFRAELVAFAKARITDVWADVPSGVDAETLAQNVVAAQEFAWISRGYPVASQTEKPDARIETPTEKHVTIYPNPHSRDDDVIGLLGGAPRW